MQRLNKKLLNNSNQDSIAFFDSLPEKVLQFGEGNFLRAFVDWMINELNKQKLFNGKIVIVQPIAEGQIDKLNQQDGLYTLISRGIQKGQLVEEKTVIQSVSRGINPYKNWSDVLECAANPELQFVVSNTTEAGIAYDANDKREYTPPTSFPGKLTVFLYERFKRFNGDITKGLIILPCELIDRNGEKLKEIVLRLADEWQYPAEFKTWILEANYFLNTLVDRVVSGYPKDEIEELTSELGYQDDLMVASEIFHFWVIEGPKELSEKLPLEQAGLNVVWTDDMTPYRTRKVRILNGAHTSSVPAAFMYGHETVEEMVKDPITGKFVKKLIYDEIIPSIDLDKEMLTSFADDVLDRFSNPFIKHYLESILLNCSSKFKTRVLPSILEYKNLYGKLPEKLTFSMAAFIAMYHKVDNLKDDRRVLDFFNKTWSLYEKEDSLSTVVETVLANEEIWEENLNKIDGLHAAVTGHLENIFSKGIGETIKELLLEN